jgi:hypothetical protein
MGNYYSNTYNEEKYISSAITNEYAEEFKIYEKEYYLVTIDKEYYLTTSLDHAKIYIQSIINIEIANNYGYHIQVFEEEEDFKNKIIYTLNRFDPTSLFCSYNFYTKYTILKVKSLPFPHVVDLQSNKKDD